MTDRFIRMPELLARTGLSERTIYNRESAGTFPARVRIGPNAVAWRESELVAWMADPTTSAHNVVSTTETTHVEVGRSRRAVWDAAMARYQVAQKRMEVGAEKAADNLIEAEFAILGTRAPDRKAVLWKMKRLLAIAEHSEIEQNDLDHLMADIGRLLENA